MTNMAIPSRSTGALEQPPLQGCFHCGLPCSDDALARAEKRFCCQGCLVVHDLLTETGLGHYYDLRRNPGTRITSCAAGEQWTYLDEPGLSQQLLDFTDGRQSRVTFHIPAIHCLACVWLLENLFRLHPGVGRSQVYFAKREAAITFAPDRIKLSGLVALLVSIGYEPTLTLGELEKAEVGSARPRAWLQIGVAGFAFGNIMLFSIPQYFGLDEQHGASFRTMFGWASLVLALPVLVFSAADFWKSALLSLRQRMLTLDVPIALGLAAIYGQSVYEIVSRTGEGYCDSLTGLILFLLAGRLFQAKTQERMAFDRDYKSFFPLSVTRRIPLTRPSDTLSPSDGERDGVKSDSAASRAVHLQPAAGCDVIGGARGATRPTKEEFGETRPAQEERVALSQLAIGDRIIVRSGELIPADARLVDGPAFIDYSFVTGESEPVGKSAGELLYAGGQQMGAAIELETVKAVSQSYLTSLWDHEAFRKDRGDEGNTLTNRYSRRFTLLVVALALAAGTFWLVAGDWPRGLKAFTSVLIVACPCALALAAPFTLGTVQRWLAPLRVFFKNALVLERLARVDAIVFDKTGTLTSAGANAVRFVGAKELHALALTPALSQRERENRPPSLDNSEAADGSLWIAGSTSTRTLFPLPPAATVREHGGAGMGQGEGELSEREATWIFSLTRHSTHPHSVRISESFGGGRFPEPVRAFLETPGQGIEGRVNGREIWVGSAAWLASRGAPPAKAQPPAAGSVVHVAIDGRYRGTFVLASAVRPAAEQLLARLVPRYELALLSGDNERERKRFRTLFGGGASLLFNQSPLDKLGFIRGLQDSGRTVMMVGDGLNDAGALKQADVGVAVVERIGAFSPASDVILDAARVPQLFELLNLARQSGRIVRAGFIISALYNLVGVSIAAAGWLSPLTCAVLMPLSSASVVLFACGLATWAVKRSGLAASLADGSDKTLTPSLSLSERERGSSSAGSAQSNAANTRLIREVAS